MRHIFASALQSVTRAAPRQLKSKGRVAFWTNCIQDKLYMGQVVQEMSWMRDKLCRGQVV